MAAIDITDFRGARLAANPRTLEPNEATSAANIVFDTLGSIRALGDLGPLVTTGFGAGGNTLASPTSKAIYPYVVGGTRYWLEWTDDVDVAPGPIKDDTLQRLYYTGDGVPKMTFNTIFATGSGKYPRSSRPLGIPAPTAAPTVSATLPESVVAGAITEISCASLKMIHECKSSAGRQSGSGSDQVHPTVLPASLTALAPGTRIRVASVVDTDHVTITGVGDIDYACIVDKLNYGLAWENDEGLWRRRKKAYWNFLIPSGATLEITNHGLEVGDIIQVVASSTPMAFELATGTDTLDALPLGDMYSRTATLTATGNIVFSGSSSFLVERNGTAIDPTVPQQNYTIEARSYVYTYVSDLGEEGPPSPASDVVSVAVGDPVTVNGFTAPAVDGRVITHRRIYRTNTGSETTDLQFVAEIPLATTSYVDTLGSEELGEVIPSETWDPPPAGLTGLVMLPNGSACGFFGKTLCFSEPGYPHAWPEDYQYTVDYDIVGTAVYGQSVVVATKGTPYVASGQHPRQVGVRKITDNAQACVAKNSVVTTAFGVVYVSAEGLLRVSESGVDNITERIYTPPQWRNALGISSLVATPYMHASWHENVLRLFVMGPPAAGYSFSMTSAGGVNYSDIPLRIPYATHLDPTTGALYCQFGGYVFSGYDTPMLYTGDSSSGVTTGLLSEEGVQVGFWSSKIFSFKRPVNMAYALVTIRDTLNSGGIIGTASDDGELWVEYLDAYGAVVSTTGVVKFITNVGSTVCEADVIRLANLDAAASIRLSVYLQGRFSVDRIQVAESIAELR